MNKKNKKRIVNRLKILEGQVRGVQKMVEEDKYCVDILHQTWAIKQALSSIEDLVLRNHLLTHVIEQIKSGKEPKATREIIQIYKLSKRK